MKFGTGNGQYAGVSINMEPTERGSGISFESHIKGGAIPKEFIPSIEKGIRNASDCGPLGQPVTDFKVNLVDGKFHQQDSSARAFEIAAWRAARGAFEKAGTDLLEPVMSVDIRVPSKFVGAIMGNIAKKRGQVLNISQEGERQAIEAEVPLVETFGWITDLRSMTQGQAECSLQFSRYKIVPEEIKERLKGKVWF